MGFWAAIPVIGDVIKSITGLIDQAVEDKDLAAKLKAQVTESVVPIISKELDAQTQIIVAEAKGASWLQRNWRPMLMCSFNFIIIFNYVLSPIFSLPRLELVPDFWELLKLGVGGYILGRSAEKVVQNWRK